MGGLVSDDIPRKENIFIYCVLYCFFRNSFSLLIKINLLLLFSFETMPFNGMKMHTYCLLNYLAILYSDSINIVKTINK